MPKHFDNLLFYIPDLVSKKILDIGSGKGKFLVQAAQAKAQAIGIEKNPEYITKSLKLAKDNQVDIKVIEGLAENLPFTSNEFDFINLAEVIEHVEQPTKVLTEAFRVLKPGGQVYISVPSRFSFYDTHYHLYGVNWLPRPWSESYIKLFNKAKDYNHGAIGRQKLSEMNYYTPSKFEKLAKKLGFKLQDTREIKIGQKLNNRLFYGMAVFIYRFLRLFYFKSFHFLLKK